MNPIPLSRGRTLAIVLLTTFAAVAVSCHKEPSPTKLPPPHSALAYYPGYDSGATQTYLESLNWDSTSGHAFDGDIKCADPGKCGGLDKVRIQITPESLSYVALVEAALKRDSANQRLGGYIVAKIHNMDKTHPFGEFNLAGDSTGYLWAGPTKDKGNRFAVYSIDPHGAATLLAAANSGTICRLVAPYVHPQVHVPPPTQNCISRDPLYGAPNAQQKTSATSPSIYFLASNPVSANVAISQFDGESVWFSCSGGCCEASGFQIQ